MKTKKRRVRAGDCPTSEPNWIKAARLLAAPLSGFLLIPAFPPYNITLLAWFAIVPFLWSLRGTTPRGAALRGYLFGVAYLATLFWWLAIVRYPAPLGYAVFGAIIPVVFVPWSLLTNMLMKRRRAVYGVWLPASLWTLFEYAMSHGSLALPWWSLGNTQANCPLTIQTASLGGVYLISFLIILVNLSLESMLPLLKRKTADDLPWYKRGMYVNTRDSWAAAGLLVVLSLVYGAVELGVDQKQERPVRLALIQANFEEQEEKDANVELGAMLERHIEMTGQAVAEKHPDIVVWSETVTPLIWLTGPINIDYTLRLLKTYGITLVAGAYNRDEKERDYNSVVAIDPEKGQLGEYRKIQVVPFGEYFPYRAAVAKISPWAGEWIKKQVYEYDTWPGRDYTVFDSRHGRFGAVICFESVFPQFTRRLVKRGAEYIFVITNDAWFLDTSGTYQHAAFAALRAVENRRYVIQVANTGVTNIVDPYGRVVSESNTLARTILYGTVYPLKKNTLYTKYGDVFVWTCLILSFIGLTAHIANRYQKYTSGSDRHEKIQSNQINDK